MSHFRSICSQLAYLLDAHSVCSCAIQRNWGYAHNTTTPLAVVCRLYPHKDIAQGGDAGIAGCPSHIQLRHIAYPTLVIAFLFLAHLCMQPFHVCLAYRCKIRFILSLGIQQSASGEKGHLCVIRYYSLSIAVVFFQPPLMSIKSCNTIAAILTLNITEGIDKLNWIALRISNGSAYKRASYSVFYYILVHLTFLYFYVYDSIEVKVTLSVYQ